MIFVRQHAGRGRVAWTVLPAVLAPAGMPARKDRSIAGLGALAVMVLALGAGWLYPSAKVWAQPAVAASGPAAVASAASAPTTQARYTVRIDAPDKLRVMLAQYLDLERWRFFPHLTPGQLRGLMDKVPKQAEELLAARGYFSPQVKMTLDAAVSPAQVTVQVTPGESTLVRSVDLQVTGANGQPDTQLAATLRKAWTLPEGEVFDSAAWETAKSNALLDLLTQRYPTARITGSQALVDPQRHAAALSLHLATGQGYTFGAIRIEGLKRYPATIVQRLSPIHSGDPYAQDKLLDYQARLQGSGYFRTATVAAPLAEAQGTQIPVLVQVDEYKPQKLGLGLGYSSNTGERVQTDYENLNILGRAWRLNTALKLETLQQSLSSGLTFPRLENGARYGLSADVQHANIQGLTTRSLILGGQRQRLDGPIETVLSLQYITERQDVAGLGSSTAQALMPNYSWTRRRLDNPLDPTTGTLVNAQIGGASKALLSDQNFIRMVLRGVDFIPLGASNQIILRGEVASVLSPSANGIPQQELFRAGGIGSVRGYAYQSLGVAQGDAIVGGRALLTASVEAVHWITPKWGASVFYDTGNAADSFNALKPVAGYGVGARWRSPVGIISVDLAYGQATQSLRLEFNAGVNF